MFNLQVEKYLILIFYTCFVLLILAIVIYFIKHYKNKKRKYRTIYPIIHNIQIMDDTQIEDSQTEPIGTIFSVNPTHVEF